MPATYCAKDWVAGEEILISQSFLPSHNHIQALFDRRLDEVHYRFHLCLVDDYRMALRLLQNTDAEDDAKSAALMGQDARKYFQLLSGAQSNSSETDADGIPLKKRWSRVQYNEKAVPTGQLMSWVVFAMSPESKTIASFDRSVASHPSLMISPGGTMTRSSVDRDRRGSVLGLGSSLRALPSSEGDKTEKGAVLAELPKEGILELFSFDQFNDGTAGRKEVTVGRISRTSTQSPVTSSRGDSPTRQSLAGLRERTASRRSLRATGSLSSMSRQLSETPP